MEFEKLASIIADTLSVDPEEITMETSFTDDLGADSLDLMDIVVALDENGENTLKVYGGIDKRTKKVILKYANEAVYPGKRILVNELTVQGVAKHVIKAL